MRDFIGSLTTMPSRARRCRPSVAGTWVGAGSPTSWRCRGAGQRLAGDAGAAAIRLRRAGPGSAFPVPVREVRRAAQPALQARLAWDGRARPGGAGAAGVERYGLDACCRHRGFSLLSQVSVGVPSSRRSPARPGRRGAGQRRGVPAPGRASPGWGACAGGRGCRVLVSRWLPPGSGCSRFRWRGPSALACPHVAAPSAGWRTRWRQ
jgi:hypothetical protein